jgi:hypothetical protein
LYLLFRPFGKMFFHRSVAYWRRLPPDSKARQAKSLVRPGIPGVPAFAGMKTLLDGLYVLGVSYSHFHFILRGLPC